MFRCAVRRDRPPRVEITGEREDGLWTTGRPDDPRGSELGLLGRGSQSSAVAHSPGPRPYAPLQSLILDRIQEFVQ